MRRHGIRGAAILFLGHVFLFLGTVDLSGNQKNVSTAELVEQFKSTNVFWRQFEVAKQIVTRGETWVLQELRDWLSHEDRHLRGNAAFIFASLGDDNGLKVIGAILTDTSDRREGQGVPMPRGDGRFSLTAQIEADRYYAVHLLGELKDPRALPILIPLLADTKVNYNVAWALGEIGGRAAVQSLIDALGDKSSDVRVIAIQSLQKLGAKEALPRLLALLADNERSHFGEQLSVAAAAKAAIAKLRAP